LRWVFAAEEQQLAREKVLIIEDDDNLQEALRYRLEQDGYVVHSATDGEEGLDLAREKHPDLIILDIMLPVLDGLEVCRILRQETATPIIMLTAKAEEVDRVVGLELGADDYVVKPFNTRELLARIRAVRRRTRAVGDGLPGAETADLLSDGDLQVNLSSHSAMLGDRTLALKPKEFSLLVLLMSNRNRAFTRDQILERIWGFDWVGENRTVDVHVRRLREKIEVDPSEPTRIVTVRGVGYRFEG
jgi:DNA-binding response OmpR family regulator